MDLMEAKGYLQAVADNWNDAPKAQKAIQTVLDYVDFCYDEQNRLLREIASLQQELVDERYRHDRYADFSRGQDEVIDRLKAELRAAGAEDRGGAE